MNKLSKIIESCKKQNGIIYYNKIKVINENTKNEYYIDSRTCRNNINELNRVYPFAYFNGHYWYICPDCEQIHTSEILGKIQTRCCIDIDCERMIYHKKQHFMIKRQPIILEEDESEIEFCK